MQFIPLWDLLKSIIKGKQSSNINLHRWVCRHHYTSKPLKLKVNTENTGSGYSCNRQHV